MNIYIQWRGKHHKMLLEAVANSMVEMRASHKPRKQKSEVNAGRHLAYRSYVSASS